MLWARLRANAPLRLIGLAMALGLVATMTSAQQAPKPDEDDLAGTSADACPLIAPPVRFCGTEPAFVAAARDGSANLSAYYTTPEGIEALMIIEPVGAADGLTVTGLQRDALEILAQTTGQPTERHPVLESDMIPVSGIPSPNLVYRGDVDGTPIVYSNTMVLLDHSVSQFVTLEVGASTYSPRHRDLHMRFLGQIQVNTSP